ncbi:MAG: DSD1 family PLP-dependent enzyme [Hyphomicrobiales bacterium]|nr:DSD1 family PLP-dependent enzyme [Hyphomicrobiales bacterium]
MNIPTRLEDFEVGYNIPAAIGMDEADIQTPCLILDLDALEKNVKTMRDLCTRMGVRHRVHGKMHKSADIAHYQIDHGNAVGICCQKVSEAEAFARAGVKDILVSNQVRDPAKIDRLARLPKITSRTIVCVDDIDNVAELSAAALKHATNIDCLVEIDCGAGRCGVQPGQPVVDLAKAIIAADGLTFSGIQAYQGAAQHVHNFEERKTHYDKAISQVRDSIELLGAEGIECDIIGGAGTGSYYFEGNSGVFNEMQCGSYAFMDADYQRILDKDDKPISEFENSLFILTSVMSHSKADKAICDAGLKAQSVDSGLPVIFGRDDVEYIKCSDEHGVILDPDGILKINEKLKLIPGHCDPTCNVHDWYVGVRDGKVETLWPVTARGLAY